MTLSSWLPSGARSALASSTYELQGPSINLGHQPRERLLDHGVVECNIAVESGSVFRILSLCLADAGYQCPGHRSGPDERGRWSIAVCDAQALPTLLVARAPTGLRFATVQSDGRTPNRQSWGAILRCVRTKMEQPKRTYRWVALVGRGRSEFGFPDDQRLAGARTLAGMSLFPATLPLVESVPRRSAVGQWERHTTWPLKVLGSVTTRALIEAESPVMAELHRLCSFLALTWDRVWSVREGPEIALDGPTLTPSGESLFEDRLGHLVSGEYGCARPMDIPQWVEAAWGRLEAEVDLVRAMTAHLEGMRVEHDHPSLALIAYVAAIEALGNRRGLTRCDKCNQVTGSTSRFSETLARVLPAKLSRQLAYYSRRSNTAHSAEFHGFESLVGLRPTPFANTSDQARADFHWRHVPILRAASRELLLRALAQGAPRAPDPATVALLDPDVEPPAWED